MEKESPSRDPSHLSITREQCQQARLTRDARFDGLFFIAVKSTGIFCRCICPAKPPNEKNVQYCQSAIEASELGYRPCLRCRPDSAPHSPAWMGTDTTLNRAMKLIQSGELQEGSSEQLACRLGISSRYLRQLFQEKLGTSPKQYALYQQCLFAKQLLHQSKLSISDIAFASGFNSIRRFNDCFSKYVNLSPSQLRKEKKPHDVKVQLRLSYRPPYNWEHCFRFLSARAIEAMEECNDTYYTRTIRWKDTTGSFTLTPNINTNHCELTLELNQWQHLKPIVDRIRTIFDLDTSSHHIDERLSSLMPPQFTYTNGLRIPGVWDYFEAGIRAILGQQISVKAAIQLVRQCVLELGEKTPSGKYLFPTPRAMSESNYSFLKIPQSRRDTLTRFAQFCEPNSEKACLDDFDSFLSIKGIGQWTVDYMKMRAQAHPDIWLKGDKVILNRVSNVELEEVLSQAKPWRSYLTFQIWNQ